MRASIGWLNWTITFFVKMHLFFAAQGMKHSKGESGRLFNLSNKKKKNTQISREPEGFLLRHVSVHCLKKIKYFKLSVTQSH